MSRFLKVEMGEVAVIAGSWLSTSQGLPCCQQLHVACCSLACVNAW